MSENEPLVNRNDSAEPAPTRRRQYSAGYYILISSLIGIVSMIIGLIVFMNNLDTAAHMAGGEWANDGETVGIDQYRMGNLNFARSVFSACNSDACKYLEIESSLEDHMEDIHLSASRDGNSDSQFLLSIILSNHFNDTSNYTSMTFPQSVLFSYAASTSGHAGALMTMGYRHANGYGVPKKCETAALNYLEVAKPVANIYANSIPRAVELIRLNVEKDKKILSVNEISLFTEVANTNMEIALAVGKRFLLGTDGFPQDYDQARLFLDRAALGANDPAAWALLGYMHALGLGTPINIEMAENFFEKGIDDGLGKNGLGYLRFKSNQFEESFGLFNASATSGSSDGMFNLASMFLTGTGTPQNFQKAFMWFTEALRRGHTPAGYALAVMHLNGIGTVRDCTIAVNLLKEVAERGEWVSANLRTAYALMGAGEKEVAAVVLAKLAEAGHQVSQENLAHLIESGQIDGFLGRRILDENSRKIFSQRYYELAAEQGSIGSELKLGDFAYYGVGLKAVLEESDDTVVVRHYERESDFTEAFDRYQKTLEAIRKLTGLTGQQTPAWLTRLEGTTEFNLGYMYHMGLGVRKNLVQAGYHYRRAVTQDSHGSSIAMKLIDWFISPQEDESSNDTPSSPEVPAADNNRPSIISRIREIITKLMSDVRLVVLFSLSWLVTLLFFIR